MNARPAALLVVLTGALAAGAGCVAPELPAGYQLSCSGGWQTDGQQGGNGDEGDCPDGHSCMNGCCVRDGEQPTCQNQRGGWKWSTLQTHCVGGCGLSPGCAGSCMAAVSDLLCLDEASTGIPQGVCSQICEQGCEGVCRKVSGLAAPGLCLASCVEGDSCSTGFRCDCAEPPCACVPDCRLAADACGPGTTVNGARCDSSTGLCHVAAACTPTPGSCVANSDCCTKHCCNNACSDGPC